MIHTKKTVDTIFFKNCTHTQKLSTHFFLFKSGHKKLKSLYKKLKNAYKKLKNAYKKLKSAYKNHTFCGNSAPQDLTGTDNLKVLTFK